MFFFLCFHEKKYRYIRKSSYLIKYTFTKHIKIYNNLRFLKPSLCTDTNKTLCQRHLEVVLHFNIYGIARTGFHQTKLFCSQAVDLPVSAARIHFHRTVFFNCNLKQHFKGVRRFWTTLLLLLKLGIFWSAHVHQYQVSCPD